MQIDDFFAAQEERQIQGSAFLSRKAGLPSTAYDRKEADMPSVKCPDCDRAFKNEHAFKIHWARTHKVIESPLDQVAAILEGESCPDSIAEIKEDLATIIDLQGNAIDPVAHEHYCSDIDECRRDFSCTPCGADPCELVAAEAKAHANVDAVERIEPYIAERLIVVKAPKPRLSFRAGYAIGSITRQLVMIPAQFCRGVLEGVR
jgi:hypothetical protein